MPCSLQTELKHKINHNDIHNNTENSCGDYNAMLIFTTIQTVYMLTAKKLF